MEKWCERKCVRLAFVQSWKCIFVCIPIMSRQYFLFFFSSASEWNLNCTSVKVVHQRNSFHTRSSFKPHATLSLSSEMVQCSNFKPKIGDVFPNITRNKNRTMPNKNSSTLMQGPFYQSARTNKNSYTHTQH